MLKVGLRASQNVGQECGKSTDLGVIPIQSRDDLLYAIDEATLLASANRANQSPPCCNITAHDDILNGGFGEVAAGSLREMSVRHKRGIKLQRASFEYEPNCITETRHLDEAELRKLARLEGCKSRATDTGGRGKRGEREPLRTPPLCDQVTDR
jgi:hypothetical protein